MTETLDQQIAKMRTRATDLMGWYACPPMASDVLDLLDAIEDKLATIGAASAQIAQTEQPLIMIRPL